jgi:four helix bundle protein
LGLAEASYARSFRELVVYQKQRSLALDMLEVSRRFPADEKFSLTDQLRRASRSTGGQIAEAWAKRRYEKHFIAKLTDADAEQQETQHWILSAHDCGYLSKEDSKRLLRSCAEIGRMLQGMIDSAASSCQDASSSHLREDSAEFFQADPREVVDEGR